jgi:RNA polymerase sigma factor (TIGR02999 family)
MNEVTRILNAVEQGDPRAAEQLLPLVYEELRRLAASKLAQERPGQTLDATALVHEAYLRLVADQSPEPPGGPQWQGRGHFFAAAAEAMRRILVDNARRKHRLRHGGGGKRLKLDAVQPCGKEISEDVLAVNEALDRLAAEKPVVAEVVKLRYFAGLTIAEIATALQISVRTANRHWSYARAWLFQQLHPDRPSLPER